MVTKLWYDPIGHHNPNRSKKYVWYCGITVRCAKDVQKHLWLLYMVSIVRLNQTFCGNSLGIIF